MYYRPEQVLEQYELEVKSVSRGRESYICETDQGTKVLKEYRGSKERADFLSDMLAHLRTGGLLVESISVTKEGSPVTAGEDGLRYLLLDAFAGAECDTRNREDMLAGARNLAELHNIADAYPGEVPEFVKTEPGTLLSLYEKHSRELHKVRNYIRGRKKKTDFESLFVERYSYFMQKAEAVTELLKNLEPEPEMYGFCHGDYNQHNLIFSKKGVAVVHFDSFSYQLRVSDLANFMRKMLEKNNWNTGLALDFIRAYDGVRRLSPRDLKYLYLYLAYPEKFWKIANHYYNAHKAWISGRSIEKLKKLIGQEDAREDFLKMLFYFTS